MKPGSGHEHSNESQQENQNATADRQHDGHEGDDGFNDIVRLLGGLVSAHEEFLSKSMILQPLRSHQSKLFPGQAFKTPAVQGRSMKLGIQITLKAMQDIDHVGETVVFQGFGGVK